MTTSRRWFEQKVCELGLALRRLPGARQDAALKALKAARHPADRQGTGGQPDSDRGESGTDRRAHEAKVQR